MRYFVTLAIVTLLVVMGVVLFRGTSNKPVNQTPAAKTLYSYADSDAKVRLTIDGRINGDDVHRQIVITVGRNQRIFQVVQGYQGHVIQTKVFANNESAYDVFLHALEYAGFTKERNVKTTDSTGVCAQGYRYTYETIGAEDDQSTWSTSCGGWGTFNGQPLQVRSLFTNQITNYDRLTASVAL